MSNEITTSIEIGYPERDGTPLGETDLHRILLFDLIIAPQWYLKDQPAYVAGNMVLYYEEGNPRASIAPDVFVVLGVEQYNWRILYQHAAVDSA